MKEKPESVRFIMNRQDTQNIIGYIENEDGNTATALSATLTFSGSPEWIIIFGFHFYQTKLFKLKPHLLQRLYMDLQSVDCESLDTVDVG